MNHINLKKDGLEITLTPPDIEKGYYRGTRFDHSGIFLSIVHDGYEIAGKWFDGYDPYKHDTLAGTSEEFEQCGYDDTKPGETFLKPGVGLLIREDEKPYDHFRLYRIADFGRWTVNYEEDRATFVHKVADERWGYIYEKTICLIDGNTYEISHRLQNTGCNEITGDTYNHNFFTFGDSRPGPAIDINFPFKPSGTWRSEYDSVALTDNGIRFSRALKAGESVFMGNLKPADGAEITGEVFSQSGDGHRITFHSDKAFHRITFWSNHRVGCIEPFIPYRILPGETLEWKYLYRLQ